LQEFARQAAQLAVASVETRMVEDDVRSALLLASRYADLVVLSQDEQAGQQGGLLAHAPRQRRLPEFLALRGVQPVLVVPCDYGGAPLSGVVMAGWDGSLQATRAIHAALPLLRRAADVRLVLINPDAPSELHGEVPGADMARHLARQEVAVQVVVEHTRATVGEALMGLARDCGAGLMVCGAYGHSRYREWILGGATRELFERARMPLLIAH
jgi:nucleotide-binding universal stress UspA family protein